jgi:hypothetical protein
MTSLQLGIRYGFVLFTVVTTSCGSSGVSSQATPSTEPLPDPLTGRPSAEVIRIKYNRAKLDCQLELARAIRTESTEEPALVILDKRVSQDSWDLLSEEPEKKTLQFRTEMEESRFSAEIRLQRIEIKELLLVRDEKKRLLRKRFSPVLKVEYSTKERRAPANGREGLTTSMSGSSELRESANQYLFSAIYPVDLSVSSEVIWQQLSCHFQTELKPEYEGHSSVESND